MELDYGFMIETFYKIWDGIGVTLGLTALSLLIALPISFYMAVVRLRGNKLGAGIYAVLRILCPRNAAGPADFTDVQPAAEFPQLRFEVHGSSFNIFESVNPFWYAVIVFSLNTIALLTEVFRSA